MKKTLSAFCLLLCCFPIHAADGPVVLHNRLGTDIQELYGHARGHEPWLLAEAIPDGGDGEIDRRLLRACRRLIAKCGQEDDEAAVIQFFNPSTLEDAGELTISLRKFSADSDELFPYLVTVADESRTGVAAGVTFSILASHIEAGMTRERWAEFMDPLAVGDDANQFAAVELAYASWNIDPPGAQFIESEHGEIVGDMTISSYLIVRLLPVILEEFDASDVVPWRMTIAGGKSTAFSEEGLAETPDAESIEVSADAGFGERRAALAGLLPELIAAAMETDAQTATIVMGSDAMRYRIDMDFSIREITVGIARRQN